MESTIEGLATDAIDALQEIAMEEFEILKEKDATQNTEIQMRRYNDLLERLETRLTISFSQRGTSTSVFFSERVHRDAVYDVMEEDFFRTVGCTSG